MSLYLKQEQNICQCGQNNKIIQRENMDIFLTLLADIFQLILTNFMENKALYLILYQVHFDLAMFQYFTKIDK